MAYTIKTYSGANAFTIQDGTINSSSTSLTLIGRDYTGYGPFLNTNFINLLENFAGVAAPTAPLAGQLWYDKNVNTLKLWSNVLNDWKPIGSSLAQNTQPLAETSSLGDLWVNTNTGQLYVFNDGAWQLVGPDTVSEDGTVSGEVVEVILDSSNNPHTVIKFFVKDKVTAILSYDETFTPQVAINGFATIKPGFNLISTGAVAGIQVTGDVSNALSLSGISASQFLRSDQTTSTPHQVTVGNLIVGSSLSLSEIQSTEEVKVVSLQNGYDFNLYSNVSGTVTKTISVDGATGAITLIKPVALNDSLTIAGTLQANSSVRITGALTLENDLLPNQPWSRDIGKTNNRFGNVFANIVTSGSLTTGNIVASGINVGNITVTGSIVVNGGTLATQAYVASTINTPGSNAQGTKYISTSAPSGTATNGDIWYQI